MATLSPSEVVGPKTEGIGSHASSSRESKETFRAIEWSRFEVGTLDFQPRPKRADAGEHPRRGRAASGKQGAAITSGRMMVKSVFDCVLGVLAFAMVSRMVPGWASS